MNINPHHLTAVRTILGDGEPRSKLDLWQEIGTITLQELEAVLAYLAGDDDEGAEHPGLPADAPRPPEPATLFEQLT